MNLLEDMYWAALVAASPTQPLDLSSIVYKRTAPEAVSEPCTLTASGVPIHVRPGCRCRHGKVPG